MISVCIASYNGEKYIREQLLSILNQLSEGDEVIVSDDGSTDRTLDIIADMKDDRIKVVHHTTEHGYTKNFENALTYAKGDMIFLADQDDVWMDHKVKTVTEVLKKYPFAVHDTVMTDENLNMTAPSQFERYHVKPGFWHTFVRNRYNGCCMAFTKEFLKKALPFPKNQKLCRHDYWLPYLAELHKEAYVIDEPLIYYRRYEGTTLNAGEKSSRSFTEKIVSRGYCLIKVLTRKWGD